MQSSTEIICIETCCFNFQNSVQIRANSSYVCIHCVLIIETVLHELLCKNFSFAAPVHQPVMELEPKSSFAKKPTSVLEDPHCEKVDEETFRCILCQITIFDEALMLVSYFYFQGSTFTLTPDFMNLSYVASYPLTIVQHHLRRSQINMRL